MEGIPLEFTMELCNSFDMNCSVSNCCELMRVSTLEEAQEVSDFLLQPGLFGTRLTPGEVEEFSLNPSRSIGQECDTYWFSRNEHGFVRAVMGIRMNSSKTGIYEISAMAVHSGCRQRGMGRRMLEFALKFVAEANGRGLIFETSSDSSYAPMHTLLDQFGFKRVGRFPDFYYPGEDTLWYYHEVKR